MFQLFSVNNPLTVPELGRDDMYSVPELAFPLEGVAIDQQAKRPYIYYNMVSSVDGKIMTAAQSAAGLGSETDAYMMGRLRAAADAVMTGAETFRRDPFVPTVKPNLQAERNRYFPDAPQPMGIVISSDGNLPADKTFWQGGRALRVVLLGEKASTEREQQWQAFAQVYRVPSDQNGRPDAVAAVRLLHDKLGIKRLLVEGGPALNYSLMTNGFADELFWTLAPKIVGGDSRTLVSGAILSLEAMLKLELVSIYQNGHELFMRYRFSN